MVRRDKNEIGLAIPPTGVGGLFKLSLHKRRPCSPPRIRPTAVGGWFKHSLHKRLPRIPPTAVGGLFKLSLHKEQPCSPSRIPPTAVGGWFKLSLHKGQPCSAPRIPPTAGLFKRFLEFQVARLVVSVYSAAMFLEPFTQISFAFQLHYELCFRTHRRKALFSDAARVESFTRTLEEICQRHGYHLLDKAVYPDHIRSILSLRPSDTISKTLQKLKGNLSALLGAEFGVEPPMWADGFLARSVGRVRIDAVKKYIGEQAEHHGYDRRVIPPVFRYRVKQPKRLTGAHSVFDLSHHLVIATYKRRGLFGAHIGQELVHYWLAVAEKKDFAIDAATVLPDHVHLLIRIAPKQSVESCALALMNNGQHWYGKHYSTLLVKAKVDRLWQPSAYAGTTGELTTALLKSFLKAR